MTTYVTRKRHGPHPTGCTIGNWLGALTLVTALLQVAPADDISSPILRIEAGGHTDIVRWLGFTTDGRYLLSAGDDKVVRVWDVAEPTRPTLARSIRLQIGPGDAGRISAAALAPNRDGRGAVLAIGGIGVPDSPEHWGDITLVDFVSGKVLGQLRGHTNPIASLAFSPDGQFLASGSGDNTVRVWTVGTINPRGIEVEARILDQDCAILEGHTGPIYGLAFIPGNQAHAPQLVSASDDCALRVWQRNTDGTWATRHTLSGHTREVSRVVAAPNGTWVASASFDCTVRLWNPQIGKFQETLAETQGSLTALAVSPDGSHVLTGSAKPFECIVWRVSDGTRVTTFSGHDNTIQWAAYHPKAKLVATTGGNTHDILLWDPATGRQLSRIVGTGRGVYSVAFSPDGRTVAFGSRNMGEHLKGHNPLERTFNLGEVVPGAVADDAIEWQRSVPTLGTLTARVDAAALTVEDAGRLFQTIRLPQEDDRIRCYSFCTLAQRPHIVVGSVYGLTLYDVTTGRSVNEYVGHSGEIWSVAVSPDNRMLVSGAGDQTFRLWNLQSGELLESVFVGTDRQWVTWTPPGYYKASSAGDKLIGWQVNHGPKRAAEFFYAWQFRDRFQRPDVLARITETLNVQRAATVAHDAASQDTPMPLSMNHNVIDSPPPSVTILDPTEGSHTNNRQVRLRAVIVPRGAQAIEEVFIRLDGRPLTDDSRPSIEPISFTNTLMVNCLVTVPPGEHELSVFARTPVSTSEPVSIRITRDTSPLDSVKPTIYALAVGVSDYRDSRLTLNWADRDAIDVADALESATAGLYAGVEAKVLTNDVATREAVVEGLEWLADSVTQYDLAFVLLSGHGVRDKRGKYYFAPHGFDRERVTSTGVRWSTFQDTLTTLPCKVLLAMDTCRSGPLRGNERSRDVELDDEIRDLTRVQGGVIVMTSSTGRELSWENPKWSHGAFALALIEGLTGERGYAARAATPLPADYNADGLIHLNELDVYVTARVKELTEGAQHPTTDRNGTSFPLARVK